MGAALLDPGKSGRSTGEVEGLSQTVGRHEGASDRMVAHSGTCARSEAGAAYPEGEV